MIFIQIYNIKTELRKDLRKAVHIHVNTDKSHNSAALSASINQKYFVQHERTYIMEFTFSVHIQEQSDKETNKALETRFTQSTKSF